MARYLARRLLLMIPTLFGISILVFGLTRVVPGGPVETYLSQLKFGSSGAGGGESAGGKGTEIPAELRAELERMYGFDKPVYVAYWDWIKKTVQFDFGESHEYREPVVDVLMSKLPVSLTFGIFTFLLVYGISIPLGVYKAVNDGSSFDVGTTVALFVGYSIPNFALAILLIVFLCGGSFLDWFPLQGLTSENFSELSLWEKVVDYLHHIVLPLFSYVLGSFALTTFMMKNSFLEQVKMDYVRTAKAKGVSRDKINFKHILRNALIPIATEIGEFMTIFLAGSIFIEQIFNLDGIGLLNYESILSRDYPVVLAIIIIASLAKMLGIILSDILYVVIDPRINYD